MKKIKAYLETGFAGCEIEEEFEVEDNATEKEIEEQAREVIFDRISWGWEEMSDDMEQEDSE